MRPNPHSPCCATCKWSGKVTRPLKLKRLEKEPLAQCNCHDFIVWKPEVHFCCQFTPSNPVMDFSNIRQFYHNRLPAQMMAGQVYAWCEVTYLDELSPDETYTVRKPMPVATHEEYLALLIIQKSKRFQAMHSKLMHDIKQKYASATLVEQDLHVKHAGIDPKFVKDFLRYLEQIKSMK